MRFITLLFLLFANNIYSQIKPLPNAHAHNDYEHTRPLLDALAHGFTSVEADVHLIDGELYVSHNKPSSKSKDKTLEALYLKPLQEIAQQNGGKVYPNYSGEFFLMIDIKADGEGTYSVLKKQLENYAEILTSYKNGQKKQGAVTIFLSGARPIKTVHNEAFRMVAIDGRPGDIGKYDANFMPVISDNYNNHLHWNGKGKLKKEELEKLQNWVNAAHANGQKVRLWANPEQEKVWKKLKEIGVDLLNTDELERLQNFLLVNGQ